MNYEAYIQSGAIETYVLGLATPADEQELWQMVAAYPQVEAALRQFEAQVQQQALANAVPPPAAIWQNIQSQVSFSTPKTTNNIREIPTPVQETAKVIAFPWRNVAAAAAVLLAISTLANFYFYNKFTTSQTAYNNLLAETTRLETAVNTYQTKLEDMDNGMRIMLNPSMQVVKMAGTKGFEASNATVYWNKQTKDVYVLNNSLPKPSSGKQYQLWAIVDGKAVDAGMLQPDCAMLCKMKTIPNAQAFAISLEPEGGVPEATGPIYVLGKI